MLCFPAVLFSGAILPVHLMAGAGAVISIVIPSRWAFEAMGHDLGARRILAEGGSPLGPPLLQSYGNAGTSVIGVYWTILIAFTVVFLVGTWVVLIRTTRQTARGALSSLGPRPPAVPSFSIVVPMIEQDGLV